MKPSLLFLAFAAVASLSNLAAPGPDLVGTMVTEAGKPLANGTVFIYTAGPKVGVGTL